MYEQKEGVRPCEHMGLSVLSIVNQGIVSADFFRRNQVPQEMKELPLTTPGKPDQDVNSSDYRIV